MSAPIYATRPLKFNPIWRHFCAALLGIFLCLPLAAQDGNYIIFLHNRYLENHALDDPHSEYGLCEYNEILEAFRQDEFVVISEKRPPDADVNHYAQRTVRQVDSLIRMGVQPDHITVIGTSKGGYIAQMASTQLANPAVNFVFIGCFQESDIQRLPKIQFCGNILTIYEKSDVLGVSAVARQRTSKLEIRHFQEIELHTGLKHGFLYKALPAWIEPCKRWARRDYALGK